MGGMKVDADDPTMAKPKISGIYRIKSPSGQFYIGSSVDVFSRWSGHKSALRSGRHHCQPLQRAAAKYGVESLTHELLAECGADDLRELEQLAIDLFKPEYNASSRTDEPLSELWQNPSFRAAGSARCKAQIAKWRADPAWRQKQAEGSSKGLAGLHKRPDFAEAHKVRATDRLQSIVNTPEIKAKAAEARRRRYEGDPDAAERRRERGRLAMAALHANADFKARLAAGNREFMKALRADPEARERNAAATRKAHAKRIRCLQTGQVFECIEDAARWCGLSTGSKISAVLHGRRKTAGGYSWELLKTEGQDG